jgi:hypothetical protein
VADLTRALLLPDVYAPDDRLLKTLSIYWDQIVLPDYLERVGSDKRESEFKEVSAAFMELEQEGVIFREERVAAFQAVDPADLSPISLQPNPSPDETSLRVYAAYKPFFELIEEGLEIGDNLDDLLQNDDVVRAAGVEVIKRMLDIAAEHYMERMRDSFALSTANNLAPLARSAVSHIGSMTESAKDAARGEAALLSTAIHAFEVDPDTPVEDLLRFREKHAAALGRFRASLVDLSEGLRQDADPTQLLAEARDRYRNRVVPALGDLESALDAGRIRFFLRSLVGATAVSLGPVDPVKAVEGGATIMGQTLNYAFSREKLIREHPFGYLHQVSNEFSTSARESDSPLLSVGLENPEERLRQMFRRDLRSRSFREVMHSLWVPPSLSPLLNDS